jgi:hypothetical protein
MTANKSDSISVTEASTKTDWICDFCKRSFSRESTLLVHMCEQRRRRQEQHERGVQLGFRSYLRFYEIMHGSSRLKSFDDFADSPYYRAFVKFGRYCVDVKAINPERFTDWLVNNNKKIDRWASDQIYDEYLVQYLASESVSDALARSIEFAIDWAEQHQSAPHDLLRYGNDNAVCHGIVTGRLSAWAVYNCDSGTNWLSKLHHDLIAMIWPYIDSDVWQRRFQRYPADQIYAREILTAAGW